ncbi:hypothetical protein N8I77_005317 [Diaporthe amygdali]|uniref:SH3 domain-containing protein n=1 Tax=Phomopsis amygdali TaxID=1214568 RepID=A0AAD9W4P1_PHOAM|nr:hypothetical protein N8I77_005317 [Diaporthe amygdali]
MLNWTLTVFAFLAVVIIHCRKFSGMSVPIRADDILILVSFIVGIGLVSLSTWAILDEGQGEHQQSVPESQLERAAKSILVAEAIWTLVTGLLRIAACLLIHSIFSFPTARRSAIVIMVLSAGLAVASIVQIFLICKPFAAQWDPHVLGSCGDQIASFMALETIGLVLDLGILLVPAKYIMGLQMSMRRKIQLVLVFNVGAVVFIITGLRMAALRSAVSPDFTYSQSYLSLLSASGCMTGIICCASPTISGIVQRVVQNRRSRWTPNRAAGLQFNVSEPTARDTRTQPSPSEGGSDHDVEKGSDSSTDVEEGEHISPRDDESTDECEEISLQDDESGGQKTAIPSEGGVHLGAVALLDFHDEDKNKMSLVKGQQVWIHYRPEQGWLVAQNLETDEIGLVPERSVGLSGYDDRSRAERAVVSLDLQCRAGLGRTESPHH